MKCGDSPNMMCPKKCVVGCTCPQNMWMERNGECVMEDQCQDKWWDRDPCNKNPCRDGGTCAPQKPAYGLKEGPKMFICLCKEQYYGRYCEFHQINSDPCASNPCKNDAECVRPMDDAPPGVYACNCKEGFYGKFCEKRGEGKIHPCDLRMSPCMHRGICVRNGDDYKCLCQDGFTGRYCEELPNFTKEHACTQADVCNSRGRCVPYGESYSCVCHLFCTGKNCENCMMPNFAIRPKRRPMVMMNRVPDGKTSPQPSPERKQKVCRKGQVYNDKPVCPRICGQRGLVRCKSGCGCPEGQFTMRVAGYVACLPVCPTFLQTQQQRRQQQQQGKMLG